VINYLIIGTNLPCRRYLFALAFAKSCRSDESDPVDGLKFEYLHLPRVHSYSRSRKLARDVGLPVWPSQKRSSDPKRDREREARTSRSDHRQLSARMERNKTRSLKLAGSCGTANTCNVFSNGCVARFSLRDAQCETSRA